jgi:opacity protein-like surface antigen
MRWLVSLASLAVMFCLFGAAGARAADLPVKASPSPFQWRWYVEGRYVLGIVPRYDVNTTGIGSGTYAPGHGFGADFALGVYITPNWRAEVEVDWSRLGGGSAYGFPHDGHVTAVTVLANGLYSFNFNSWVRPYLGAGIGFVNMNIERVGAVGGAFVIDGNDTALAGALHAGLDFPVWQNLTITSRYTLLWTGSASFGSIPAGVTTTKASSLDNLFSVGLRLSM